MKACHRFLVFLILLFVSFGSFKSQQITKASAVQPPKREFRGAWIATVVNLDWPSSPSVSPQQQRNELVNLLDALYATGINAVVFQIRPECDAFYNSPYEPWSYWLTGSQGTAPNPFYDPLQFGIEEAHKRGMELHAWFNPYRAERSVGSYPLDPKHVTIQNPSWAIQIGTYKFLNPGLQEVRDYVSKIVADVVRRYDVDGVHMDDYFYPYPPNQITWQDTATFRLYSRGFTDIGDWRRDNVNLLLRQIYDSVRAIRPTVKFGMSPAGIWKNGVPPGTLGQDNYSVIYCDAVAWLQGRYIDYIAPQLYWPFGGGQDYALLQPWWGSQRNGRHVYTGNAVYRIGESTFGPATEIANQVDFNRRNPDIHGSIFFRANNIRDNRGGIADLLESETYRTPAIIPVMDWKETIPPNTPQNLRAEFNPASGLYTLRWDSPSAASDGDTASRYIVYRFTSSTYQSSDLENSRNLIGLVGQPSLTPSARIDTPGVRYYFAVAALDRNNNESAVGNLVSISVPVGTPVQVYPADGEPNYPQNGSLRWSFVASALRYRLEVARDSTFGAASLVAVKSLAETTAAVGGLSAQETYYWRVAAGSQGEAGPFSPTRSFRTGWPLPPTPLAPVNVSNAPIRPTFVWSKSGGTSFRVRVAAASWTGATVLDTTVADTVFTSNRDLAVGPVYIWRVSASNAYGSSDWSVEARFRTVLTLVQEPGSLPTEYSLSQNYPNPFNPTTTIQFGVPVSSNVRIAVYDVLGQVVSVLMDDFVAAGTYKVVFDGSNHASGMYFYTMTAGNTVLRNKMLLLK